jgi:hypothetical protein
MAVARPMPLAAPVIIAVFPSKRPLSFIPISLVSKVRSDCVALRASAPNHIFVWCDGLFLKDDISKKIPLSIAVV